MAQSLEADERKKLREMRPPFTDTHVHFHDLGEPELEFSWLDRGGDEHEAEVLGEYGAIRAERYRAEDFIAETRFQDVERVINVQNATGGDPVAETVWNQASHDRLGVPHGFIGYADLSAADARETIDRHREHSIFRGIRDPRYHVYDDYIRNPDWERGVAVLAEHELAVLIDPPVAQAADAAALAGRHQGATVCLDHCLWPAMREDGDFARWRDGLVTLAQAPNTIIKVSGLGMVDNTWTTDSLRSRVLTCIEVFGVERTVFATNWPVDRLYSSYGDVLDAYAAIVADFTADEQEALFSSNAKRIFGLG